MGTGAALGLWGRKKAVNTVERYVPPAVVNRINSSVKGFMDDVSTAQRDGKGAMGKRERELRSE
jgi:hypothetical protein